MKILPKKVDIDKEKIKEREREIKEGISLATKLDTLRQTKLIEEKNLKEWRDNTLLIIQGEIDAYSDTRDALLKEVIEQREIREKMLEPLDAEWKEVNKAKQEIVSERQRVMDSEKALEIKGKKAEEEKNKISILVLKIKKDEKEIEKSKSETIALKEMAQREYEIARFEHEEQTKISEKKFSDLHSLQEEYEVGIKTNKIAEKAIKQKESELIIKEAQLRDREETLERELQRHEQH